MNKVFSENAWRDFMAWVQVDRKIARKINELLKDIERNGHEGIGKPEPLRQGSAPIHSISVLLIHQCRTLYGLHFAGVSRS